MPVIRLNAFFKDDDGHGWSEQHDVDGGVSITSLTPYLVAFDNLMAALRRPMLGGDAFYVGCRASYKTGNGQTAASNLLRDPPARGTQTNGGVAVSMTAPEAAVKLRFQNAASTANSDIYLRGMWSQVIEAGVLQFGNAQSAAWKALMITYSDALRVAGYGWTGINPALTSRGNVTGYAPTASGTILLNVDPQNGVALPAVGTKTAVIFARINHSKSVLNRSLVCVVRGAGTVETVQVIAAGDFLSEGTYILPVKGFIPYDHVGYFKLAKRATGRPFGVAPGRRPVRQLA